MKKNIFAKIGAGAVVLTLVTASLVGGTFAKYTSTVTASGKATVAKWSVDFKDGSNSITDSTELALTNTNGDAGSKAGTIAPGSEGTITLDVDGTKSEVGYTYSIEFDTTGLNGVPLKFYSDAAMSTPISFTDNKADVATGSVKLEDVGTAEQVKVYWQWDPDSTDTADNALGTSATATVGTIAIKMTAAQITEADPITP